MINPEKEVIDNVNSYAGPSCLPMKVEDEQGEVCEITVCDSISTSSTTPSTTSSRTEMVKLRHAKLAAKRFVCCLE